MYSAILALIIALMMIVFVIYRSHNKEIQYYICRKSEIENLLDIIPDDCIVEILIGTNAYEQFSDRDATRRSL